MSADTKQFHPTDRARVALSIKSLMITGLRRRLGALRAAYRAFDLSTADDEISRIVRYNYALALRECDRPQETIEITGELIPEYYDALEIGLEDVMFKNLPDIAISLGDVSEKADQLKHLADCLDLRGRSSRSRAEFRFRKNSRSQILRAKRRLEFGCARRPGLR